MQNTDQPKRLLDLLPDTQSDGFGSAMIRLAQMAAAQHRAQVDPKSVKPWSDLTRFNDSDQDTTGHGRPIAARSTRDSGSVTTEGDR